MTKEVYIYPQALKDGDVASSEGGITLLDYFAGLAMQGLASTRNYNPEDIAKIAYYFAEEMMKERERRQQ